MNKLLNADLHRMIKNRCFQVCLGFMCLLGLLIPFMQFRNMQAYGTSAVLESTFFAYPLFVNILLAVFCLSLIHILLYKKNCYCSSFK